MAKPHRTQPLQQPGRQPFRADTHNQGPTCHIRPRQVGVTYEWTLWRCHRVLACAVVVLSFTVSIPREAAAQHSPTIEVLYWTNRQIRERKPNEPQFLPQLGKGQGGTVHVSIPANATQRVTLDKLQKLASKRFFQLVRQRVNRSPNVLVFVHGFNCSFDKAVRGAGRLARSLDFEGTVIVFSWPSQGGFLPGDYAADDLMVMSSIPAFVAFLKTVQHEVPAVRLHILAHSMGCRLVTGSLVAEVASGSKVTVNELLLAAPDIDADSFRRVYATTITKSARRVTLYVSARDQALAIARVFHGRRVRLGDAGEGVGILAGIDIIDVSQAPNEESGICTGHSYYATSSAVVADIRGVLAGTPVAQRGPHPRPMDASKVSYWAFPKANHALVSQ